MLLRRLLVIALANSMLNQLFSYLIHFFYILYVIRFIPVCSGEWAPGSRPIMCDMPLALQKDIVYDDAVDLLGQVSTPYQQKKTMI